MNIRIRRCTNGFGCFWPTEKKGINSFKVTRYGYKDA